MDMVSERFILEYEVRDSIFFLSMILCVLCVKCGRVFHSLSKDYSLFCFLFSVRLLRKCVSKFILVLLV